MRRHPVAAIRSSKGAFISPGLPQNGHRTLHLDVDNSIPPQYLSIVDETMDSYPLPYTVTQYGYQPKKVAISFDDGPDPAGFSICPPWVTGRPLELPR